MFLNAGVASVKTIPTSGALAALQKIFTDKAGWAESTVQMLRDHGFNGTGAWSEDDSLSHVKSPVAYTRLLGFMAGYGKIHGGTHMQPCTDKLPCFAVRRRRSAGSVSLFAGAAWGAGNRAQCDRQRRK